MRLAQCPLCTRQQPNSVARNPAGVLLVCFVSLGVTLQRHDGPGQTASSVLAGAVTASGRRARPAIDFMGDADVPGVRLHLKKRKAPRSRMLPGVIGGPGGAL
jgi:hypothetical protein